MALQEREKDRLNQEVKKNVDIMQYVPPGRTTPLTGSEKVKARAEPNQRLVELFGIDNVFTNTDDAAYRREFVRTTRDKMKAATHSKEKGAEEDWTDLRKAALCCVNEYFRHKPALGAGINLADMAQFLTLKVSLEYLFDDAAIAMKIRAPNNVQEDVTYIGRRINELWLESKQVGTKTKWQNEVKLHKALLAVTTMTGSSKADWAKDDDNMNDSKGSEEIDPLDPRRNPMNLLLPAYETMWRVVVRCVLEIQFREGASEWREILLDYLEDLKSKNAMKNGAFVKTTDDGIAPIDIAKEIMRLYPPSRRVHRLLSGNLFKAEIEATQRSALFGSHPPETFEPKRWQEIINPELRSKAFRGDLKAVKELRCEEGKLGFMPFAFVCTADAVETGSFGLKLVALLTAAILSKLDDTWQLKDASTELPPSGVALRTEREAYNNLVLLGPIQDQSSCLVQ